MKTDFRMDHGHCMARFDGKYYIVDTGSPVSIGNGQSIQIGDKTYSLSRSELASVESLNASGLYVVEAAGLIGMNVLAGHSLLLDFGKSVILWDEDVPLEGGNVVNMREALMGSVLFDIGINGETCQAVLDTGAWIPYVAKGLLCGAQAVDTVHDWNPALGDINADCYMAEVSVGSLKSEVKVAEMPSLLEMTMGMMNVKAVVGLNAFPTDKLLLDFASWKMTVI